MKRSRTRPRPTRVLFLASALFLSAACGGERPIPAPGQPQFPSDAELGAMLLYLVEDGETPGIVVAVQEPDDSTRVLSSGEGGPGTQPLGARSLFEIGSITKTFTGTLLADMIARGEVAAEDPVSAYLPEDVSVPEFSGREITLLDLATHTSGLPGAPAHTPADPQNPWADWTVERLYTWLSDYELQRAPGAQYEYSNVGMGLLGLALARAAGTALPDLMRERIFRPLGMDMTGYAADDEAAQWLVLGHQMGDTVPHWTRTEAAAGAGGLLSNAQDLLKYLAANLGPPATDLERAMRAAHQPRRPAGGDGEIGFGWVTSQVSGRTIVRHTGGTGGFRTELAFDPVRGVGIVVLTNSASYTANLGLDLIAAGPPPSAPEVAVDAERLRSYAGEYESAQGLPLFIGVDSEGQLTGQAPDQIRFRLYATSDTTFYAKRVPFTMVFHADLAGAVEDLVLGIGGRTNRFARIGDDVPASAEVAGNAVLPVDPDNIALYEGTYAIAINGELVDLRVYGEADRLMGNLAGQILTRLVPRGDHEFAPANDPNARVVFHVDAGRAQSVTLTQNGETTTGARRE